MADFSLKQLALSEGAKEELDTADIEVFAHGTNATFAQRILIEQGGCLTATGGNFRGQFHTLTSLEAAWIFAGRRCSRIAYETPMIVGLAISRGLARAWESGKILIHPPMTNPPPGVSKTTPQSIFHPEAVVQLHNKGFFFQIKYPR